MNKYGIYILSIFIGIALFSSCSSTPDEVLSQEKMAQVLADIHIGESIVELERSKFYNDSLKKTVKQSILLKHGITQEQLDTSFVWYGHNIEKYVEVYDRVIEIIDDEIKHIDLDKKENVNVAIDGDSIDCWQWVRYYNINKYSATQYITFNLKKDQYWKNGDYYIWRTKLINSISPVKYGIVADYADGTSEYNNIVTRNNGWTEISLISDSTKKLNRVYGYIYMTPVDNEQIYIDSISLVRMRVDKNIYQKRSYNKTIDYNKK